MGLLANLKLRRKLFLAMAPLAVMVIIAGIYSSLRSSMIDAWYSALIDNEVKAVRHLDNARTCNLRYEVGLYRLLAETDRDRLQVIDGELDNNYSEYKTEISEAARLAPAWAPRISASAASFAKVVLDTRPIRAAALASDKGKAATLLRSGVEEELQQTRGQLVETAESLQKAVDQRSDQLTDKTHRSILVTWVVIGLGLLITFSIALYALNVDVVQELFSLRDSIRSLASGQLDEPIPFLNRPNEIGEISRSLQTLQQGAKERETHGWV